MKTIFKREFVIEQHRKKKTRREILKVGKDLNLNAMFIKRTLDRYAETKDVNDRPRQGRPRSQRTKRSIRQLAKEHNTSVATMHTVCKKFSVPRLMNFLADLKQL